MYFSLPDRLRIFVVATRFAFSLGIGAFLLLVFISGCPRIDPCSNDADCSDGSNCTINTCEPDGGCSVAPACAVDHCIEDQCVECIAEDECADDDLCTTDVCTGNVCTFSSIDCDDEDDCTEDVCDPTTGTCTHESTAPIECDDGIFCNGQETSIDCECAAGEPPCGPPFGDCQVCFEEGQACAGLCSTDADCDDGFFCNGAEMCDGCLCQAGEPPCETLIDCLEESDMCLASGCESDADCDDGFDCNGMESCNVSSGDCERELGDCDTFFSCDENGEPILGTSQIEFTLNVDDLLLTVCDDVATAPVRLSNGVQQATLQTGDRLTDPGGIDQLNVTFVSRSTFDSLIRPMITGVESLFISDFGSVATTLDASLITGISSVTLIRGLNPHPFQISDLSTLIDVTIWGSGAGISLNVISSGAPGEEDVLALTLKEAEGGIVSIMHADDDTVEIVNLISQEGPNALGGLTLPAGGTGSTVRITGVADVTLDGPINAAQIDASMFQGSLFMTGETSAHALGIVLSSGSGNDTLFGSPAGDTILAGAGNDRIDGLAGDDNLTLGTGADVVVLAPPDENGIDTIMDFVVADDFIVYTGELRSIDSINTTASADGAFQSGVPGTGIAATTTVYELIGATVAAQSAGEVVTALGVTALNNSNNAGSTFLLVVYTGGGGAGIWLFLAGDGANIDATELTLLATLPGVAADALSQTNFP